MKVINIYTGEVIWQTGDHPEHKYYTTPEYWVEYQKMCRIEEEQQNKIFYGEV